VTRRLLAAALLLGTAAPLAAQTTPSAAVKPIAFTQRTLANGLKVYAIRDTTTPNVAVQMWYDVGAKDDPKGRSGFAHLFEHLMFKATRNLVSEQMDRLTEDVGGYNNASTNDDYTNYYEVVPANHLQRLLFAEADRMASLVVEPTSFASERDVVKEEYRQSVLAQPYGKLYGTYLPEVTYTRHPYARGTIGDIGNLEAASIEDVRAFHATFYRPDNAVLVVSGNFDPAQLDRWIDQYFAAVKRPAGAIPRVTVAEPPRTAPVSRTVYEANTPLPAVLVSYHIPPDREADNAAIAVLDTVLATGESSRLYQSLVYRDRIANTAETFLDTKQATGNLNVIAIMAGGKTAAQGEAAIKAEVARLRDQPVSDAELARAKNQILTAAIRRRETAEGKAFLIAEAAIVDGDPHAADRQLAAIGRVTSADVQRVARRYLGDNQAATIRYLPAEAKPAGAASDAIAVAPTVTVADLRAPADVAVVTPAAAGERLMPPPAAAPVKATLPRPVETRLANGLRVITVERHDLPLVTAALVASGGGATDPAGRAGAASLAAEVMTKGTRTRSATQIAAAIESLGGALDADAGRDGASIEVTVKSDALAPAMGILADVARNPAFAADEIERARAQAIDTQAVALSNPAQLAGLAANRLVYGDAPYGAPLEGTPASLKALAATDLQRSYRTTWQPGQAALLLVGDITPTAAHELAERNFGDWRPAAGAVPESRQPNYPAPRVLVIDMPGAGQAGVVVARPGIARADERYYPLQVANTILGGGFSSRLNQEVRIKRGLAYGAGSSATARRLPGLVTARTQTKNPTAPDVATLIVAEMKRMGAEPIAPAELDTRKASLVGNFGRGIETTAGIAGVLGDYVLEDVALAELDRFTDRVNAVDAASVSAVSRTLLDPAPASIVVVGDAKQFLGPLQRAFPQLTVVKAVAVDLDKPTLN